MQLSGKKWLENGEEAESARIRKWFTNKQSLPTPPSPQLPSQKYRVYVTKAGTVVDFERYKMRVLVLY